MGPESMLIGVGVVSALKLSSCAWSHRNAVKRVLRRRREEGWTSCLVMPAGCGKSTLVKSIASSNKEKCLIVDMDEMMMNLLTPAQMRQVNELQASRNNTWVSIAFPVVKTWFNSLQKEFPNHRKLIVSNSPDLADYLNILDTTILCPTKSLVEKVKIEADEETKEKIDNSFMELISSGRDIFYFSNYDSIKERVCNSYGLRESI